MTDIQDALDGVYQEPIGHFTEKAYLNYAMYVILDRALPHIGDGLKPVQRRIIYAMSELGLKASSKYKKSARTVGDVLGKFHPHGDTACYEAMVLMAQKFSYRHPLVDGQGNWGSSDDPKSFAAMRYTESRLTPFAELLLSELGQGTVDWQPNFDGTIEEPKLLPAQVPSILLNGSTGIAVGMATDIPPHNLQEVVDACIYCLENPKCELDELTEIIPGPDYPTQAEIISSPEELKEIYTSGRGSVRMRAVYIKESDEIIITHLPYQVSGAKILEQIAAQMQAKKLPMVVDLRDESDHENPTRLVIVPRSNRVNTEELMNHLFATTDLERTYRVNLNMIGLDGRPQVKNLKEILKEWLDYRTDTVKKRLNYRLDHILDRLHILDGLLIAYLNIDEVIKIIREEDKPKEALMAKYNLSERQANGILDLKLRHLAKLEEIKIKSEQDELAQERDSIEKILNSPARLKTLIKKELEAAAKKHADPRMSPIVQRSQAQAIKATDMLPSEAVTVVLSQKGWVRAGKGHEVDAEGLQYKAGDDFKMAALCKTNQQAVFIDSTGRSYSLGVHTLPSARGQGEPVTGRFTPPPGASFEGVLSGDNTQRVLLCSNAGYGFVTNLEALHCKNKNGKAVLKLPENANVCEPQYINDPQKDNLAVVTNEGRLLVFPINTLPELNRGKGNKIISIPSARAKSGDETIVDVAVLGDTDSLILYSGKRHLTIKAKDLTHYMGERGRRGHKLPRGFQRIERIIAGSK